MYKSRAQIKPVRAAIPRIRRIISTTIYPFQSRLA